MQSANPNKKKMDCRFGERGERGRMVKRKEKKANPDLKKRKRKKDCRSGEKGERKRMVKRKEKRESSERGPDL